MASIQIVATARRTPLDRPRFSSRAARIRIFMLGSGWLTLAEIRRALERLFPGTQFPQASIGAQLRRLRQPRFGGHVLRKRRRAGSPRHWEYLLLPPPPAIARRQPLPGRGARR